jgi:hypothetical protein
MDTMRPVETQASPIPKGAVAVPVDLDWRSRVMLHFSYVHVYDSSSNE